MKLDELVRVCEFIIPLVALLLACLIGENNAVPTLQQTVPPGDVAVCPLSTVQYTCTGEVELRLKEIGPNTPGTAAYDLDSKINQTAMTGVFTTVLTDISGNTLTSTATIDSVNLTDDGRNVSCRDITGSANQQVNSVQLTDVPLAPSSVSIGGILSSTDSELSVNLTWFPSRCVMVYYVEVTVTNINFTNTTTSQHITLTLQIGVEYSFRVRGADTINRLGEWSGPFVYTPVPLPTTALPSQTAPTNTNSGQLSGGAIAGIVIGVIVVLILVLVGILIIALWYWCFSSPKKATTSRPTEGATEMVPNTNDTAYAVLDHSVEGRGKDGKSGPSDKGGRKLREDPVHYDKIDHDKTEAQSKQTRSAPGGSLPSTKQSEKPKPPGRSPSASTKK